MPTSSVTSCLSQSTPLFTSINTGDYTLQQLLVTKVSSIWKKCAEEAKNRDLLISFCVSNEGLCTSALSEMVSSGASQEKINRTAIEAIEKMNKSLSPFLKNTPSYTKTLNEVNALLANFGTEKLS